MGGEGQIQNSATCQGGRAEQGLAPVLCACEACLPLPMQGRVLAEGGECQEGLVGDSTASRGPPSRSLLCELRRVAGCWGSPLSNRDENTHSVGQARGFQATEHVSQCWEQK